MRNNFPRMKKVLKTCFRIFVGVILGHFLLSLFLPSCLFFPVKEVEQSTFPHEDVYFNAPNGLKLNGWYVPPKEDYPTIIFSHGNGGNIGYFFNMLIPVAEKGYGIFIYDYEGYGNSEGFSTEKKMYNDLRSAVNYINTEKGTPDNDIILWGLSIGGAVTTKIATEGDFKAVILQNTFTNIKDAAKELIKTKTKIPCLENIAHICVYFYKFDTYSRIDKIEEPTFIISSKDDELIRYVLAEKNYAKCKNAKLKIVEQDSHNTYFMILPEIMKYLDENVTAKKQIGE